MLKKLVLYSIAAVTIGIIVMMAPIGLILLLSQTSRMATTQETTTTEEAPETLTISPPTTSNLTGSYGFTIDKLREAAQFYGESDVAGNSEAAGKEISSISTDGSPHNILVSLTIVISAGLLAVLIAKLTM